MTQVWVGTSGWHYAHWRGPFYPRSLAAKHWLAYYAARFSTVEVNNSFYRLPAAATMQAWHDATPPGFVFAVKASRYLTHYKRLLDPEEPLVRLAERIAPLGPKLGPVLFQLPPRWARDVPRLRDFLALVPGSWRCAFEFRDPSWEHESVWQALADFNAAYCVHELGGYTSAIRVTADFAYLRLHGPSQRKYAGSYSDRQLRAWAARIESWKAKEVFVYFDNDQAAYAAADAARLRRILSDTESDTPGAALRRPPAGPSGAEPPAPREGL